MFQRDRDREKERKREKERERERKRGREVGSSQICLAGSFFYSLQTPKRFSCPRVRVLMMHNVVIYPQGRDGEEKGNTHRRPARLIDIDVSRITAARVRASSRSFLGTRIEPFREQAIKQIRVSAHTPVFGWLSGAARRGGLASSRSFRAGLDQTACTS